MTITFPCEQCGQRYQVDGALAGKRIKCKKCQAVVPIPIPRSANPAPPAQPTSDGAPAPKPKVRPPLKTFNEEPSPRFQPHPAPPTREVKTSPAARAGLAATSWPAPAWPASPPEAFDDGKPARPPAADLYDLEDRSAPATAADSEEVFLPRASAPKKGPKTKKKGGFALALSPAQEGIVGYAKLGVVALVLVLILASFVTPIAALVLFIGGFVTGIAMLAAGTIWMIVTVFTESVLCGVLWFFVPVYGLYYLITR
ncbi:MAG: hypothetical protein IRY99_27620, partial [Isosphaeraceae bacterium]|nr:hypothetical protein [Isosphaeraceae bacterium]